MADEWVMIRIYPGSLMPGKVFTAIQTRRATPTGEVIRQALTKLGIAGHPRDFDLVEVSTLGQNKERKLTTSEMPGVTQQSWFAKDNNLFALRRKDMGSVKEEERQARISRFLTGFKQPSTLNVDDLCAVSELTEEAMLENLANRFGGDQIYTYVGSILVAVNPFKVLSIYQPKYVDMYRQQPLGKLAPHIYAVANAAYFAMLREKRGQCVVVSGESGSGKTESTKYLLRYLMVVSNKAKAASVEERIVGTSVILEAFGNAKTVTNNNSSRFGKFISLKFREDGAYTSASIEKYLLEKSRINFQAEHERNYHVFYYLLAGADESLRRLLWLKKPEYYHYLNQSWCYQIDGEDGVAQFNMLVQSMEKLRFSQGTQTSVFTVLAALLHIGNIVLVERSDEHGVEVKNMAQLKVVSDLLRVKMETLTAALTTRKNMARGEVLIIPYSIEEAIGNRDAMAKSLYASLFDWMVEKMNKALSAKPGRTLITGHTIGLLDIFGFEVFAVNSFEQFCINYANEQLQFYFNQHVFKLEQDEYSEEGIQWNAVDYADNLQCLELISKRPTGLMHILDDESRLASATDETLLVKFSLQHKDHPCYAEPYLKKYDPVFMINHYAANVDYHIKGFREKNNDLIRADAVAVLKSSTMPFLRQIVGLDSEGKKSSVGTGPGQAPTLEITSPSNSIVFSSDSMVGRALSVQDRINSMALETKTRPSSIANIEMRERSPSGLSLQRRTSRASKLRRHKTTRIKHGKVDNLFSSGLGSPSWSRRAGKNSGSTASRGSSQRRATTVGAQFMNSLSSLMDTLSQSKPYFIRCIKSNTSLTPEHFDETMVLRQLRYTGMLETVRIRKAGYAIRHTFEDFKQSYWPLCRECKSIPNFLQTMKLNPQHYQVGRTKIFLRRSQQALLQDKLRILLEAKVLLLQRWARARLLRIEFLRIKQAIITIQSWYRGHQARKRYGSMREQSAAAICIQATWKGFSVRGRFQRTVSAVTTLQRVCRGFLVRRRFHQLREERRLHREEEIRRQEKAKEIQLEQIRKAKEYSKSHKDISFSELDKLEAEALRFIDKVVLDRHKSAPHRYSVIKEGGRAGTGLKPGEHGERTRRATIASPDTRVGRFVRAYEHGLEVLSGPQKSPGLDPATRAQISPEPVQKGTFEQNARRSRSFDSLDELERHRTASIPSENIRQRLDFLITKEKSPTKQKELRLASLLGVPTVGERRGLVSPSIEKSLKVKQIGASSRERTMSEGNPVSGKPQRGSKKDLKSPTAKLIKGVIGVVRSRSSDALKVPKAGNSSQADTFRPTNAHFLKAVTFKRLAHCSICKKGITGFFKQGIKCSACQLCFHRHCIPNATQCLGQGQRKVMTMTSQTVVNSPIQLLDLDRFLADKIAIYQDETEISGKRDNIVDVVFKSALREFHSNLVVVYAQATAECSGPFEPLTTDHLVTMFSGALTKVLNVKQIGAEFPITMGLNAFKPLLDEFAASKSTLKAPVVEVQRRKVKQKRKQQRKDKKAVTEHNKHRFRGECCSTHIVCEVCCSLIEVLQTGLVCETCKLTCHEGCLKKTKKCARHAKDNVGSAGSKESQQFGVTLVELAERTKLKIPVVLDLCINNIEVRGLFTEGLYRKSASAVQVRLLHKALNQDPYCAKLDDYGVHTVAAIVKQFLRDLPEPLLTFGLYTEFLQATAIEDKHGRYSALLELTERLPKPHQDVLERLVYHLARVAQQEQSNKMSVYNLALIFAPCLMLPPKDISPLEALADLQRQRSCTESLIDGQKAKIKATLSDISQLDAETYSRSKYLSVLSVKKARSSLVLQSHSERSSACSVDSVDNGMSIVDILRELDFEEQKIKAELEELEKERTELTEQMPTLQPIRQNSVDETDDELSEVEQSKDDGLSSCDELEASEDEPEYALTFDLPAAPSKLKHVNRNRIKLAKRRAPTRKFRRRVMAGDKMEETRL